MYSVCQFCELPYFDDILYGTDPYEVMEHIKDYGDH
jgi:hypothetical protein